MENLNKEIGKRLRFVRSIFNEGGKLSAAQFAFLLGETLHKILNYELGRAQVPPSLLIKLYQRGINPIYILTGEGSVFAPNHAGRKLEEKLKEYVESIAYTEKVDSMQITEIGNGGFVSKENLMDKDIGELIELAKKYSAVAGDIMEIIRRKGKNE
jgi:hypothetical protein